jgi:hypothetical protein
VSELREVIAAPQSGVEIETAVSELGTAGIDRARGHCRVVRRRRVLTAADGASAPTPLAALASGGSVGGLAALFGHHYEADVHEWSRSSMAASC